MLIRRFLRKMANNGHKVQPDLGTADALEAEEQVFKQAETLARTTTVFNEKASRVEKMTRDIKRKTGLKVRDSGILPAQG